jgi:hypothetical protein
VWQSCTQEVCDLRSLLARHQRSALQHAASEPLVVYNGELRPADAVAPVVHQTSPTQERISQLLFSCALIARPVLRLSTGCRPPRCIVVCYCRLRHRLQDRVLQCTRFIIAGGPCRNMPVDVSNVLRNHQSDTRGTVQSLRIHLSISLWLLVC